MKYITRVGGRLVTAVDYVTGVLVHDPVEVLETIGSDCLRDTETAEKLSTYLELTRNYYKHHAVVTST